MPQVLKHELDSLDGIDENLHPLYEEQDGKFVIPEALRPTADAVTNLFKANDNIRSENKKLQRKGTVDLSPLSEYGETVDDIVAGVAAKVDDLEEQLSKGKEGKINLDKVRQELKDQHTKELTAKDEIIASKDRTIHRYIVSTAASDAIGKENGISELLLPHVERHIKVVEADGQHRAVVVDKDGDVRISGVTGEAMSIHELVKEMKKAETFAPAFKSDVPPGGGLPPNRQQPGGPGPRKEQQDDSPLAKVQRGLAARQQQRHQSA